MNKEILERLDKLENLIKYQKNKTIFNFKSACEYLKLKPATLYKLTHQQKIPFSKPNGKTIYFDKDELDNWALSNKIETIEASNQRAVDFLVSGKGGIA